MTISLDKKTKTLLALAGVALVGLYFWSKRKKSSFAGRVPFTTISTGPNAGQVVFFGPRGNVYLPAGTTPFQTANGTWSFQIGEEIFALSGPTALNQSQVNNVLPAY